MEALQLGSMRPGSIIERNNSAMAYHTHSLQSSKSLFCVIHAQICCFTLALICFILCAGLRVHSIRCYNLVKSLDDSIEAISYNRNLKVKGPPSLEKRKEQRGHFHSDRLDDSVEASSKANYIRYLKEKGYALASLQVVKEPSNLTPLPSDALTTHLKPQQKQGA